MSEFYFEAEQKAGAVMVGHIQAGNMAEAERLVRDRYPLASRVTVKASPSAADLDTAARLLADAAGQGGDGA